MKCADCGKNNGPPDGWELEDGQECCVKDTKNTITSFKGLCESVKYTIEAFDNMVDTFVQNMVAEWLVMEMHYKDLYGHLAGSLKTKRLRKKRVNRVIDHWEQRHRTY